MTEFRKKIYEIAGRIPRGRVLTYKQVAALAGRPKAYRAVGNILNKNRDPKVFCHRVIRSDGRVGGFNRGSRAKMKKLMEEGVRIKNGRVKILNPNL